MSLEISYTVVEAINWNFPCFVDYKKNAKIMIFFYHSIKLNKTLNSCIGLAYNQLLTSAHYNIKLNHGETLQIPSKHSM